MVGRALGLVGGAWGLIAIGAILVLPIYEGDSVTVTSGGERIEQHFRKTLLEMQSLEAMTVFFFAVIVVLSLAAIYFASRSRTRGGGIASLSMGILLFLAALVSGFSIGAFLFPGAIMVLIGGIIAIFSM